MEVWKQVADYEGKYEVSNLGRVRSLARLSKTKGGAFRGTPARILAIHSNGGGYQHVRLGKDGSLTTMLVHLLVLEAFSGLKPQGMEARHLDGVRSNNNVLNLAWGTRLENAADRVAHGTAPVGAKNPRSKLDDEQVLEIFERCAAGEPFAAIACDYGVSDITVSHIFCGRTWGHITGKALERSRVTVDQELMEKINNLKRAGHSLSEITKLLGVSRSTAQRYGGGYGKVSGATCKS